MLLLTEKAPIPVPDALVSSINGLEKSGKARKGATIMACLSAVKAVAAEEFQPKASFLSKVVKGAAMVA